MDIALILFLALCLDALFGEPKWLWDRVPHPAVLMGRAIGWADDTLNDGTHSKRNGILLVVGLVLSGLILGKMITALGWLPQLILTAILLAQKSLVQHVQAVADGLRLSLPEGKRAVSMIVSRDTGPMQENDVTRAAIESAAENLSDGVIAPAFWFLIAGLPGILIYKAINTADSMIGYRTPKHQDFGWAAARLDDLLNWVPARLTALMIALTHNGARNWPDIRADAKKHRSPNAGWPEAAMARALNTALAGPRAYEGEMQNFPFVYPDGRTKIGANDIDAACIALWRTWGLTLALVALISLF